MSKVLVGNNTSLEHLNLVEGYNKITGLELDKIIRECNLQPLWDNKNNFTLSVDLVLRSAKSNEVITYDKEVSNHFRLSEHKTETVGGFWLVLANIQEQIRDRYNFDVEVMRKSNLLPIGVIKEGDDLSIIFTLIFEGNNLTLLEPRNTKIHHSVSKIEYLKGFTILSERDTMILPTLNIVRSVKDEEEGTDIK